jgi:hypothetical protein
VEDLPGRSVVGARRAAADVALVRAVAGEGQQPPVQEHRADHRPVRQVVAARRVGVGEEEHVLLRDPAGEVAQHGAQGEAAAAGVDGDAVRLRHHLALGAADEAGEVVALAEDRAAGGARHHPAHLARDVVELLLRDGQQHGIGCVNAHRSPPISIR